MTSLALGLKLSAIKTLSAVQRAINILKSAGPGAWYDPSDLATLFQDSAGTTPVTAVEQPVGLVLDKSQGLVLGAELFTGTYTLGAATTATYSGNEATATFGGSLIASLNNWLSIPGNAAANGYSEIEFWATYVSGGNLEVGRTWDVGQTITAASNAGVRTRYKAQIRSGYSSGATGRATFGATSAGSVWKVEVISVRELPGNHLIQPTATSRPTLSSRYNLALNTGFTGAVAGTPGTAPTSWANFSSGGSTTVTANADGSNTLGFTASASQIFVASNTYAAPTNTSTYVTVDIVSNIGVLAGNIITVGAAPAGFTVSYLINGVSVVPAVAPVAGDKLAAILSTTATAGNLSVRIGAGASTAATGTVQVKNPQWVVASDASLPYQRVNTDYDYDFDFSKFPPYLKFDGVDDSLYTSAIDFTSTDKMTVFAGVHKASDAAACLLELSADASANTRTFNILSSAAAVGQLRWVSYGTVLQTASDVTVNAPATRVLSTIGDISGDSAVIRGNGAQTGSSAADQGTGNYGNHVLYVGRRNNASLPFNGRIYQLAIKGKALSAGEIATVESFVNSKTKAY